MRKTRSKNSIIKPPSTLALPCMKIQGGHGPPAPRCRRPYILQQMCVVGWLPIEI